MTAEQLLEMPKDGSRHELVQGELKTMPPSGGEHGFVGMNLAAPLARHVRAQQLGVVLGAETGFILSRKPDTVRAPDIAFVRKERIPATGIPKAFWPGAPDLAVEVMSPGDTVMEVDEKVQQWLEAGTGLVWVVNPRRWTVTVYRSLANVTILSVKDELDGQDTIPGFCCRVGEIFS
jgi:Uma2 family endonuclease